MSGTAQKLAMEAEIADKAAAHSRAGHHVQHDTGARWGDGGQLEPVLQTEDAFEQIYAQCGEPAKEDRVAVLVAAREIAGRAFDEFLRWAVPPDVDRLALNTIAIRLLAAAWVINPDLLQVRADPQTVARRAGLDAKEIRELRRAGKLEAFAATAIGDCDTAASLRRLAEKLGFTAAIISPHSADFSRRFGVTCGGQSHNWRARQKAETKAKSDDSDDHHDPECQCCICLEREEGGDHGET
jgi:hypothetical protein